MMLHVYTGRETGSVAYLQPWQWHRALTKGECPHCAEPVVLQMLEMGHNYRCLSCHRIYAMPVAGLGPQDILCQEGTKQRTLQFLRHRAYERAWDRLDDYGRDRGNGWDGTGRFTKRPKWRAYAHFQWSRAYKEGAIKP